MSAVPHPNRPRPNRCMIVDLPAPELDDTWRRHLEKHQFGGVCLFRRNIKSPEQLTRLVADIRGVLGEDALIGIDQEGGTVLRVLDTPQFPSPMALGALDDEAVAREVGAVAARGLLKYGVNWDYAPDIDVQNNALNPVIGERSFGADPQKVARLGVAWAQGLEAAGVMASVKHFPGHGDTSVDSHLDLPVVKGSLRELEGCEWVPFRAAVDAGVGSIMTAHILYPALDDEHPATLSPAILTGLLRRQWGYDGVVVTDSTDMQAVAARYPGGAAAALALIAGADAVLACTHGDLGAQEAQVGALARAMNEGTLGEERVLEAQRRLQDAARRFPGAARPYSAAERDADEALVRRVSQEAITAVGSPSLPGAEQNVLLVVPETAEVGGPYEDSLRGEDLARSLQECFPHLQAVIFSEANLSAALDEVRSSQPEFVLVATTTRWALSPDEQQIFGAALALPVPHLHLALWNPYHAAALNAPALVTYGFRQASLEALCQVLRGAPARGRLPVSLPDRAGAELPL